MNARVCEKCKKDIALDRTFMYLPCADPEIATCLPCWDKVNEAIGNINRTMITGYYRGGDKGVKAHIAKNRK